MTVDYVPLMSGKMRNFCISSEIIGNLTMKNINCDKPTSGGTAYAVATLDGTLMLVKDEEIIWFVLNDFIYTKILLYSTLMWCNFVFLMIGRFSWISSCLL